MTAVVHQVTLASPRHFGVKLPPHAIGLFLAELPMAVRAAVSMALRNRSWVKGKRPAWLDRAADIRFVGHTGNGVSTLCFEAPQLGEAAPELYQQGELFSTRPDARDTALDVFGDVLLDVAHGNADSERFDTALLQRLVRFNKVFKDNFTEAQLGGRRFHDETPRLNPEVISTANRFFEDTPASRSVRLVGKLDMVRASNQTFALKLEDGQEVRGSLVSGSMTELALLLNRQVLVFGKAVFRPSRRLLRVEADSFRPATETDSFFTRMPKPLGNGKHRVLPQDRKKMAEGLKAVLGKWPGDETDEEIQAALKELN